MPNNSQGENSFIDKGKMHDFSNKVAVIAEYLQAVEKNIEMADEAVMFSWLGPSREFFNDMSECIRQRIELVSSTWQQCSEVTATTVVKRNDLDIAAAEAAQ